MDKYLVSDDSINLFIEFEHLRDEKQYINNRIKIFYSNISKDKSKVLSYLREYSLENSKYKRKYKDKQPREGYIFNVMLPLGFNVADNTKKLRKFVRELVKNVSEGSKLKYFVTLEQIGKARMLKIVILNRIYYKYGKDVEVNGKYKTINITTKIRLNHFATKTKNSYKVFKMKVYELKLLFIDLFQLSSVNVKGYIKKLSYKRLYFMKGFNKFVYVNDTLDQRCLVRELNKRKLTVLNTLVHVLNRVIAYMSQNTLNIESFMSKWTNYIKVQKKRCISEIEALEDEILKIISDFKTENFEKIT